jgi:cytochrome P450
VQTAGPVQFDPLEPGYTDSPYEQYARLRAGDPVHWSDLLHGYVLTRYDDIVGLLKDPTISVDLDHARPSPLVDGERQRRDEMGRGVLTVVLRDDPDHARLRRLLQKPFGPRAIAGIRTTIVERVDAAMAALVPAGRMDVISDFAYPLPVDVFCEILGVPAEASPEFRVWTQAVARSLDPLVGDEERAECMVLMDAMYDYLADLIGQKRTHPADDVMTQLVQAEEDGDRLSTDELLAQLVTLYVAGHEPTTALVGNGLLLLMQQPDQLRLLRERPDLIGNAVQELLRLDGPNQFVRRITVRPTVIGGRTIEAGSVVFVCLAAANRDPDRWGPDADAVRIDRPDAGSHLQFGAGIHLCLGSHLARLQAEIMLGALVGRLDDIELDGEPVWSPRMVLRSLTSLPITFTA